MFAAGEPVQGTAAEIDGVGDDSRVAPIDGAARKRAAVELLARHGEQLKRAARRYSLCAEDAEDAYQRGLEILLTKAPTEQPRELLAWTMTVVKHEALAVRSARERLLGAPAAARDRSDEDWVTRLPAAAAGPLERLERREDIARSREAIRALKPAERRTLALLAEGYSYAEIGEITGFTRTKINRCLAEGRERFRRIVASSEDGARCAEMGPLLSAFCDGETSSADNRLVREHLRSCGRCRATVRAYRSAPATVAALCPLPAALARAAGTEGGGLAGAKGGVAGLGKASALGKLAGFQKALAICAVGGATACVAGGVVPVGGVGPSDRAVAPRIERVGVRIAERPNDTPAAHAPVPAPRPTPAEAPAPAPGTVPAEAVAPESAPGEPPPPVEAPAPAPAEPPPTPSPPSGEAGGAAGEFGP